MEGACHTQQGTNDYTAHGRSSIASLPHNEGSKTPNAPIDAVPAGDEDDESDRASHDSSKAPSTIVSDCTDDTELESDEQDTQSCNEEGKEASETDVYADPERQVKLDGMLAAQEQEMEREVSFPPSLH